MDTEIWKAVQIVLMSVCTASRNDLCNLFDRQHANRPEAVSEWWWSDAVQICR